MYTTLILYVLQDIWSYAGWWTSTEWRQETRSPQATDEPGIQEILSQK